jgi:hypothetical protein
MARHMPPGARDSTFDKFVCFYAVRDSNERVVLSSIEVLKSLQIDEN